LGAELHAAIGEGGKGPWFDWWLAELVGRHH
jgi:hypothetical protein